MRASKMLLVLLGAFCLGAALPNYSKKDLEEIGVTLEFMEYNLEDRCLAKNDAQWAFYHGYNDDLKQLIKEEKLHSNTLKEEIASTVGLKGIQLKDKKTQRLLDIMFLSGSFILNETDFNEYTTFAVETQVANSIPTSDTNLSVQQVQTVLRTEKNASKLADTWTRWVNDVEMSSGDFTKQLDLLSQESKANGIDSVENYWLAQSEVTKLKYEDLEKLWKTIIPLYNKLRQFLANHITAKFGPKVYVDTKLIPVHLLGSLDSSDWVTAADRLDALKDSTTYNTLQATIRKKNLKELYSVADENTAELELGYLSNSFFANSSFEQKGRKCVHFVEETCKLEVVPRVLHCKEDGPSTFSLLRAHEEVAHIKHLTVAAAYNSSNGFLLREGPRDSVLYEAISTATSLMALNPEILLRRGLIDKITKDTNMTTLLLAALHFIPPLPLHLSYDVWRLEALKKNEEKAVTVEAITALPTQSSTTEVEEISPKTVEEDEEEEYEDEDEENYNERRKRDVADIQDDTSYHNETSEEVTLYQKGNLTADWWRVRGSFQGVGSPDGKLYEDFLQNRRVIWNKPFISKFLGPILLFQILDNMKPENTTQNRDLLLRLLSKGKSEPWENIVADLFNITEISTEPLLKYFKPLEAFLDGGAKFQSSANSSSDFSDRDFKLFLKSTTINEEKKKDVVSASEDSNAIMIVLIILAVVGTVAVVFSVVRKRIQKKRKAKDRRRFDQRIH